MLGRRIAMTAQETDFVRIEPELKRSEGLVFLGAGGDINHWITGVTNELEKSDIVTGTLDQIWQKAYKITTTGGRHDLILIFNPQAKFDMGKLAMWRLHFGDTSWISDYIKNYAKQHAATPFVSIPVSRPPSPTEKRPSGLRVVPFSVNDIRRSHDVLRSKFGMKEHPVEETILVKSEGTSNKFHYFALFQDASNQWVAANAYGRIDYNPQAVVIASGPIESTVRAAMNNKIATKKSGGYIQMKIPQAMIASLRGEKTQKRSWWF